MMVGKISLSAEASDNAWPVLLTEGYKAHLFSLGTTDLNSAIRESILA